MKKLWNCLKKLFLMVLACVLMLGSCLLATSAEASDYEKWETMTFTLPMDQVEMEASRSSKYSLVDWFKFGTGAVFQFYGHKASHGIGAGLSGTDISYTDLAGNWEYGPGKHSDWQIIVTSGAGLVGPLLVSEWVLRDDDIDKNNPFVMGAIWEPLVHNAIYVVLDVLGSLKRGYNDLEKLDWAGVPKAVTYPLVILVPAIQVWRAYEKGEGNDKSLLASRVNWNVGPTHGGARFNVIISF
jgi:hypothetical protein